MKMITICHIKILLRLAFLSHSYETEVCKEKIGERIECLVAPACEDGGRPFTLIHGIEDVAPQSEWR